MIFTKSFIIKLSCGMLVIAIISLTIFIFTLNTDKTIAKEFFAALSVSSFAGGLALVPLSYAVYFKPNLIQTLSLVPAAIRLLLTLGASAAVCLLVNLNYLWFFSWTAIFYIVILVTEIQVAISAMDLNKIKGIMHT